MPADRKNPRAKYFYGERVRKAKAIRETVHRLGANDPVPDINGGRVSLWAALDAVLEYVDHHACVQADPFTVPCSAPGRHSI